MNREGHELSLEREQYLAIVRRAGIGFLVVDRQHRVIWTNEIFRERFVADTTAEGSPHGDACHRILCGKPEPCDDCPVSRCFESGKTAHHEVRLWIRDRYHPVYVIVIPLGSGDAGSDQAMVMLLDMTEMNSLRKSDEAFLASEQRFRSVVRRSPLGMAALKLDGSFLQVNPALCAMLGYTESELLWKKAADVIHPEDRGIRPDHPEEVECRFVRRDGSILWCRTTTLVQQDRDDRETHEIVLVRDVTRRHRAVKEQEEAQRRYDELVHAFDGVVWEAEPDTLRFTFVSEQAESLLGFPRDRWLGQPRFRRNQIHPRDLDRVTAALSRAAERQGACELEYRMIASDGRTVWVRDRLRVVLDPRRGLRMRGVMTDITADRCQAAELEESHEQQREAEKTEALVRLAGAITRDFDRLLDSIAADAEQLVQELDAADPSRARAASIAREARGASERAARLRATMNPEDPSQVSPTTET